MTLKKNTLLNAARLGALGLLTAAPNAYALGPWWDPFGDLWGRGGAEYRQVMFPVNITDEQNIYVVRADLPGMRKEDLAVTFEYGILTISGKREAQKTPEKSKVYLSEGYYGSFSRSFSMPADADPNQVKAEFRDGVLTIQIAKNPEQKARSIEIK